MSLADIADIQVSADTVRVSRAGFGTPLLLSHSAAWSERVRSYETQDDVATDFSDTDSPEYIAAGKAFAQVPSPAKIKIGRCANKPTQRWALTPVAVDGDTYRFFFGPEKSEVVYTAGTMLDLPFTGQSANFTAGKTVTGGTSGAKAIILSQTDSGATGTLRVVGVRGTFAAAEALADDGMVPGNGTCGTPAAVTGVAATVAEIVNGLRSKLDAVILAATPDLDCVGSDQTTYLRVLASTAGDWFPMRVEDTGKLGIAQDMADPGVTADLNAIVNEDDDWYGLESSFNSKAIVDSIAAWAESHGKLYVPAVQDSAVPNTVSSGTDDVGESLAGNAYGRTSAWYHPDNSDFLGFALMARVLPLDPGSENWQYKGLAGVTARGLTSTQRTNLKSKFVNYYEKVGINSFSAGGAKVAGNEFIDVVRFIDWVKARLGEDWLQLLLEVDKVPFDRSGGVMIEGLVLSRLRLGEAVGGIVPGTSVVSIPEISEIDPADKDERIFGPVRFSGDLAGAINKLKLRGTLNF